jgi:hypothetical protein
MNLRVITYPILIIFIAFLLNQKGTTTARKQIHPDFVKYTNEIKNIYNQCGRGHLLDDIDNTIIKYEKLPSNIYAQCFMFLKVVEINTAGWQFLEDYEKEELLLHELGHCVLKKFDTDYDSIMKGKGGLLGIKYIRNYSKYINQYFGCEKEKCCDLKWDSTKYDK